MVGQWSTLCSPNQIFMSKADKEHKWKGNPMSEKQEESSVGEKEESSGQERLYTQLASQDRSTK